MAEDGATAVSLTPSPFSSAFRFLNLADSKNSSPSSGNLYELNEGDVLWSPEIYSDLSSSVIESHASNVPSATISPFLTEKLGLAVALTDMPNFPIRRQIPAKVSEVFHQSAPVKVPVWPRSRRMVCGGLMAVDDCGEEAEEAEGEMLPPHVIVARSHVTTFSVFEGVGRTLKGRDLCRVRNAVFQRTGFID